MDMDLKALLDYVHLMDWSVSDAVHYICQRLGPNAIDEEQMQYWYNFYRRIKQRGRRCRCLNSQSMHRTSCSSQIYCCEKPFELRSNELVVAEHHPRLVCEWDVSYSSDNFGAFYLRAERERSTTINARYIIQYTNVLSSFKLMDLYYRATRPLEYRDSKLAILSHTRLGTKNAIKVCDFQIISPNRGVMIIRSSDYFEVALDFHRQNVRNRPYASAICLTDVNLERGTFKFIDVCIVEEQGAILYNSYDRFPTLIGSCFAENGQLGLIVTHQSEQAILRFQVSNDRLRIGQLVDVLSHHPQPVDEAAPILQDEDDDPNHFAHQVIFIPRRNIRNHRAVMHINFINNMAARQEHRRNRRRLLTLTMHTLIGNKLYGFEYETQTYNATYNGHRHIRLKLDRIFSYDLEDRLWDDFGTETPFQDGKLCVLNHSNMVWRWEKNKLYCAVELEPQRTFIIWFDFDTLKWSKLNMYFLNQVYNIVIGGDDVLVETRHKTIYGGRLFDPLRHNEDERDEIPDDTKTFCFYRLNICEPLSLLTSSLISCRDLRAEFPNSRLANIFDRYMLRDSHAPLPKFKKIPSPKNIPERRRQAGAIRRHNRPVANQLLQPLRRSDRLRAQQDRGQNNQ